MINAFTQFLYDHSPVGLQNWFCTQMGRRYQRVRFGGDFDRWAEFYCRSRSWSGAELEAYQREQLADLLRQAYQHVPFYAERWRAAGLSPADLKDLTDLAKFPDTTKEDLFHAGERILSANVPRGRLIRSMTGGSTGMPLPVYSTAAEMQRHYALFWDRLRQGVRPGDRYATFQGKEVVPQGQKGPPYWRENRAANQRLYSMRHLSPEELQHYARSLAEEPFVYYQGYVSILEVVAAFMAEQKIALRTPPKAVFTTSEQLTRSARGLFQTTWRTRVWDEYCQAEQVAMIAECEHGNHHPQMEYGIIELEPVGREDGLLLAEIICTGFIPRAAPLIRYRVGDRVLIDEGAVCPCGRPGPVIKAIRGRTADYIVTPDGRKYPHISLIVDLLRNVRRTQVLQDRPEEITVRIVPFPQFCPADREHLIRCFQERIGGGIAVKVQPVGDLERTAGGKIPSIINHIPGHGRGARAAED